MSVEGASGALGDLLRRALERGGPAIESTAGERLDPAEALAAAARVARLLEEGGVRPDEPVLVAIGNRPADLAALLGIWRAGAVAVPVHVSAAPATLAALQEATGARFTVEREAVRPVGASAPPPRPLLTGAALVIFTSGTTGRPKGVVIGHERMAGKLDVLDRLLRLRPDDVVLVPLQLTFIFGLWTALLALRSGAGLRLVPRFSPEEMAQAFGAGATVLAAVPTMLRTLIAAAPAPAPRLRLVLTGGEALAPALARAIAAGYPAAGLLDLYGSTETGSCDFCSPPGDDVAGTLGAPTEGVTFRLAVEEGRAAGEEAGELQIRTPYGMLGYLDSEALTASAYADGFFRTGDLARRRPDGRLELVGRSKEIISRAGNKIAPLELDNLLAAHPDVAAALCAGVPDERLGEAIHAVIVPRAGAGLTPEALRAWAAARTERYKLPDAIHIRESLPVGATGKASRAAVVELVRAGEEHGRP